MASSAPPTTLYMPIIPPPTPAPSPPPQQSSFPSPSLATFTHISAFAGLTPAARRQHLYALIQECTPSELLFLSTTIAPLLKRDFLRALPPEVSLHILSFIDDPRTLARAALVSKYWNELLKDEFLWKTMAIRHGFSRDAEAVESYRREQLLERAPPVASDPLPSGSGAEARRSPLFSPRGLQPPRPQSVDFPYRKFFIHEHIRSTSPHSILLSRLTSRASIELAREGQAPAHPPRTAAPAAPGSQHARAARAAGAAAGPGPGPARESRDPDVDGDRRAVGRRRAREQPHPHLQRAHGRAQPHAHRARLGRVGGRAHFRGRTAGGPRSVHAPVGRRPARGEPPAGRGAPARAADGCRIGQVH